MARILVIDDYAGILDVLELMLTAVGHEVMTAETGMAGLELAGRSRPDLVLLDVDMPTMDGVSVCVELKRNTRTADIPVLMMTGRFGPQVSERARQAGALGIMPKPFVRECLLEEIRRAVGDYPEAGLKKCKAGRIGGCSGG